MFKMFNATVPFACVSTVFSLPFVAKMRLSLHSATQIRDCCDLLGMCGCRAFSFPSKQAVVLSTQQIPCTRPFEVHCVYSAALSAMLRAGGRRRQRPRPSCSGLWGRNCVSPAHASARGRRVRGHFFKKKAFPCGLVFHIPWVCG